MLDDSPDHIQSCRLHMGGPHRTFLTFPGETGETWQNIKTEKCDNEKMPGYEHCLGQASENQHVSRCYGKRGDVRQPPARMKNFARHYHNDNASSLQGIMLILCTLSTYTTRDFAAVIVISEH